MTRFDEMQSNHPQANTPWAGQTKAYETRSNAGWSRGDRWGRPDADRGAPFAVLMLVLFAPGVWAFLCALGVVEWNQLWFSAFVFVFIVCSIVFRSWAGRLWRTSWRDRELRGAVPEWTLGGIGLAAMLVSVFFHDGRPALLSWLLFGIQLAALAVVIPLTLRRYPGFV